MKPFITILITGVIIGAFIVGFFYGKFKPQVTSPQQLSLEQILSIKELHLVKHTYNDLFFLHKHNDKTKAIRAMTQVPVIVTAYIDLKEMQLIKQGDSLREIILPRARLNEPHYQVENMTVRETRSLMVHIGKDKYPQVAQYLQVSLNERVELIKQMAVANRILIQAEEEGKEYIEKLLHQLGCSNVMVKFVDEVNENLPESIPKAEAVKHMPSTRARLASAVESIPFGFLPIY